MKSLSVMSRALSTAALAWLLILPPPAQAGAPQREKLPAISAEELARRIAPLVDDDVLLVLHADLASIDVDAALKGILSGIAADATKEDLETAKGFAEQFRPVAAQWLGEFQRRGGRDAYLLLSMSEMPRGWGMLALSLSEKADANGLAALFGAASARPAKDAEYGFLGTMTTGIAGGLLLIGPERMVEASKERLSAATKAAAPERKELLAAFQSCADTQVQALLLLTKDTRRVIEELMPELPKQIGGGPSTALTRGMLWAAVGINVPPELSLKVRIQSEDAKSAAAFEGLCGRALKAVAEHVGAELPILTAIVPALTPKAHGDKVTLDLAPKEAKQLFLDVARPALAQAREAARRSSRMSNLRFLGIAIYQYVAAHKDAYPPDLQTLVSAKLIGAEIATNPRPPWRAVIYVKPPDDRTKVDPRSLMLYETYDQWDKGICVGFVDGHVEFIADQRRFDKLLAATRAATQPAFKPAGGK